MKKLLGANFIKVIYSDDTFDIVNKFEINSIFKYQTEDGLIDNINYSNNIDFKEGKKQIVRIEIERDSSFTGCTGETTVYNFDNSNGIYLY